MSPFESIVAAYAAHPQEEPFENYLLHYHRHGFVFSRPDFFAMGRPVIKAAGWDRIRDNRVIFDPKQCDCWYLMACAGDMGRMWQVLPWMLPWFCWVRIGDPLSELQFVGADRLQRLCPPVPTTAQ